MKKWIQALMAVVFIAFMQACDSPSAEKGLRLDDGQKWKVSEAMHAPIAKAELRLEIYIGEAEEDYLALAEDMDAYNQALISSCDMGGESHEVLHEWLHPHLEIVKALKSAQTQEEAAPLIEGLWLSYRTYHKFFE